MESYFKNPNLSIEMIDSNPNKDWSWGYFGISDNPNISIEIINKYSTQDLNW